MGQRLWQMVHCAVNECRESVSDGLSVALAARYHQQVEIAIRCLAERIGVKISGECTTSSQT